MAEIDHLLDDIRRNCELGEIEEVLILSEELKKLYEKTKPAK